MTFDAQDALILAENGPLVCLCGNNDVRQFAYVEWKHTVVAACKLCSRTYDYDRLNAHGVWRLTEPDSSPKPSQT